MRPRRVLAVLLATAVLGTVLDAGCGDDESERAAQAREAAADAGLSGEVQDLFALAASGIDATFQVTYPSEDGGRVVITQDPPNRRVDLVKGDDVHESRLVRGEVSYQCKPDREGTLRCDRTGSLADLGEAFSAEAVQQVIERLRDRAERYELRVDERSLLGFDARCLITTRRADAPPDPTEADAGMVCFSPEGAALLVESGERTLQATGYTVEIPAGIFDLPR